MAAEAVPSPPVHEPSAVHPAAAGAGFPSITVPILGHQPGAWQPPSRPVWEAVSVHGGLLEVEFLASAYQQLCQALNNQDSPGSLAWYELHLMAQQLASRRRTGTAERLLVLEHCADRWKQAGVVPYPHQLEAVRRVLTRMNGRAILADEVGLGKTVEAGMILKEYLLRGLVSKVLILVPASLIWQWYLELKDKFDIVAGIQRSVWDWEHCDVLIASLDTAKREPHREAVLKQRYDMLIVDEAHRLKNRRTLNWQFVNQIHRHYCLLLTATPVQNSLDELHSLVTLLKPGHLGNARWFHRLFALDARHARDPQQLRQILSHVMIRNRRGRDTVDFTPRHVHPVPVTLTPAERHFYDALENFVRTEARRTQGREGFLRHLLPLITLQREAVSSVYAAAVTLEKMIAHAQDPHHRLALSHLRDLALSVNTHAKVDRVLELVSASDEKFIIFTEYRATQWFLRWRLQQAGISHLGFDGTLSLGRREFIREAFRRHARVLVSTESGGEGINFQFCCNVINFDLPWNPQRLEQRIGRVHRLGQTRPVHIYNLATRDTIEEYILYLLDEKLDLFRQVVGIEESAWVKGNRSFEAAIARIVLTSQTREELYAAMDQLSQQVLKARQSQRDQWVSHILGGNL